ncbi:SDR family oxidoreductase [Rhizobium sp.]|jgi:NAD(P)-dependent dehydrogenase (short-subunit alcohol dehydrogenase family)|uniref:SDR family NAD(P)-dependent oxidoreductase n=1 Tax=Rhizobium sp. TaxID=391 RepID=UPI000E92F795|nr:short-chain dehydrogenase [Rhizobium sp.]
MRETAVNDSVSRLFNLQGKRALVTGGTSGIGLAIVQTLAGAGALVMTCSDRDDDVAGFDIDHAKAITHRLSDKAAADALIERTETELGGPIDILVSNAGIEGPVGGTGEAGEEDYRRVFDVNLHSAYWLAGRCRAGMARSGGGSIILMASLSALRGNKMIGTYAMSKAALCQMARNLAVELGPDNIRANAIAPGVIETPFSRTLMENDAFMQRRLQATPLRRVGQPLEIAAAALFLAGPGGAFMTGQTLVIDGGTLVTDGS